MRILSRGMLVGAALLLACSRGFGAGGQQERERVIEEPQWLKLQITEVSTGIYAEGDYQETTFRGSESATHERWFVGPLVGLNLNGSIYHPNFFRFQLNTEGAAGWGY